jgi:hypothetical protein
MKRLIVLLFCIMLLACSGPNNICKKSIRLDGEVIYAVPSYQHTRKVTLLTEKGVVIIYRVPVEQPLTNIPVCLYKGNYYWVMP